MQAGSVGRWGRRQSDGDAGNTVFPLGPFLKLTCGHDINRELYLPPHY